jgi:dTDP-4-dehydrorhamnose reductase
MTIKDHKHSRTILILGGSGLLGAHCYEAFKDQYRVITTYNNHKLPYEESVKFNTTSGLKELELLLNLYQPDVIVNTIALVTVDGCELNPKLAIRMNKDFVTNLVTTMKNTGLEYCHLIQISSDSVYGERKLGGDKPWVENDNLNPLSVYAKTKLQGEYEALKHVGPVSIIRTAFYGINPFSEKSLLWWIIDNAKNKRQMDGWENIYFNPVSATSLVRVMEEMFNKPITGIYNVGSVDGCNKFDFVEAVCDGISQPVKINRIIAEKLNEYQIRPDYSILSTDKLSGVMTWNTKWRDDLNAYLKNMLPFPEE